MKPMIALFISLTAAGALTAAVARADCPQTVPTEAPPVPDGASASEEAMYSAQVATRDYVQTIEGYLECWSVLLTAVSHNRLVNRAEQAATDYNAQLQRYRQREDLAANTGVIGVH